jgi:hypothetical protein
MRYPPIAGSASILVLAFGAVAAIAQETPHHKPGLWQNDIVMAGRHVSNQSCVDAASDAQTSTFSSEVAKNSKCQHSQITHNPDSSWTSISTCEFRPGAIRTSRTDVSGDFNSKITITMRSPPDAAPEMTMTSTWLGACKPGQKGGDVIMSDGTKINPLDATPAHSGTPAH